MKSLLFCSFIFMLFFPVLSLAQVNSEHDLYKKLTELDNKGGFVEVKKYLASEATKLASEEHEILNLWFRDQSSTNQEFRYDFIYADMTYKLYKQLLEQKHEKAPIIGQTAVITYFQANLKLRNAISRCDDTAAGGEALREWTSQNVNFKNIYKDYFGIDAKSATAMFDLIVRFAEEDVGRKPKEWVCMDGISAMNRALQANQKVIDIDDPTQLGNTKVMDTSGYIEFISDEEWAKKRKENAEKIKNYLLSEDVQ